MSTVGLTIDCYAVLGVSRDADIKDINAVYRGLALKSHPDKAGHTDAATERFRAITDAVEILRDPVRRSQLDRSLCKARFASLKPECKLPTGTSGAYGNSYPRKKRCPRERRRRTPPNPETFRHRDTFDACKDLNYMHSYGNSVHMDPNSEDSKAKRADFQKESDQWSREWQGIDPEMEDLRAKLLKKKKARYMAYDRSDMVTEAGDFEPDVVYRPESNRGPDAMATQAGDGFNRSVFNPRRPDRSNKFVEKEHYAGTSTGPFKPTDYKPAADKFAEHKAAKSKPAESTDPPYGEEDLGFTPDTRDVDTDEDDGNHFYRQKPTSRSTGHVFGPKVTNEAQPYFSPSANRISHKRFTGCNSAASSVDKVPTQSHAAKPPKAAHTANTTDTTENSIKDAPAGFTDPIDSSPPLQPTNKDFSEDSTNKNSYINSQLGTCEALKHLVPFFQQKIRAHPEQYTANELYGELNGVILETYIGWLVALRSSVRDVEPPHHLNKPVDCAHIGSWKKEFNLAKRASDASLRTLVLQVPEEEKADICGASHDESDD
ncbi:hypothetical protein PENANT_c013G02055 [Penicillium antarcticum]|uniref:J domain-containing protein n=1 Tax=Penicillium antarcticum TaxID=416450 RepID=A0A1V6Q527_9EURO|nr:hypothetical protein PENANT_c013G02055 [Penicillium antarcticum]